MLPYSPLHHLLLADAGVPLVMTSGNVSDEPIAYRDEDALDRLAAIADLFLVHDRPDRDADRRLGAALGDRRRPPPHADAAALARVRARQRRAAGRGGAARARLRRGAEEHVLRRQGQARVGRPPRRRPLQLRDARVVPGGHRPLRAAVRGRAARSSRTTCTPATCRPHTRSSARASSTSACSTTTPTSRPAWPSTARRSRRSARSTTAPGYGTDGTVWGGELLYGDLRGFERVGHLHPVRMPGGEQAIREPWRMACAWLVEALGECPRVPAALAASVEPRRWEAVAELARGGLASPLTTSAGRLFDAVAALCGAAHARQLRGPGGGRARGGRRPRRARRLSPAVPVRRARRHARRCSRSRATSRRASRPRSCPRASTTRSPAPRRRACAEAAEHHGVDDGRAVGRRVPERAAAGAHLARALADAACACSCRSGCRRTTAASPTARRPSRPSLT